MKEYWDKFIKWCKTDYNGWLLALGISFVIMFISKAKFVLALLGDIVAIIILIALIMAVVTMVGGKSKPQSVSHEPVSGSVRCPHCNSKNVNIQVFQENTKSKTVTKTTGTYKEKGHGLFYKMFIGWWFWIVDIFLWIFATLPRLLFHVGRKRTYIENSKSVSKTKNSYEYRRVCVCQKCGYEWED